MWTGTYMSLQIKSSLPLGSLMHTLITLQMIYFAVGVEDEKNSNLSWLYTLNESEFKQVL